MTQYYIGMHGQFDSKKFERDYKLTEFSGIEFCNFTSTEEIEKVAAFTKANQIQVGIHFPLNKNSYKYRDPHFMSLYETERNLAWEALRTELEVAKEINAAYVLVHFPKPMILNPNLNWHLCRFGEGDTVINESDYPFDLFRENAEAVISQLSEWSRETGVPIVLEIELLNRYLYEGILLKDLLERYPNIKVCLDSARLHVLSQIDSNFDAHAFIKDMAPYTHLVHLSNIQVDEKIQNGHHPVLKGLCPSEGWCNIDHFLSTLTQYNKDVTVLYEHRSDWITDDELNECYEWVKSYFETA